MNVQPTVSFFDVHAIVYYNCIPYCYCRCFEVLFFFFDRRKPPKVYR